MSDPQERQYARGTTRGDRPTEITDQDGDTWVWVNADKKGIPGYQFLGGGTSPQMKTPAGPAHTRGYVVQARGCHLYRSGEVCTQHDHHAPMWADGSGVNWWPGHAPPAAPDTEETTDAR